MKKCKSAGFTLVEVTIVLLIGGVLLASFGTGLLVHFNNTKLSSSKEKLAQINSSIIEYLAINRHLPCPADREAAVDSARFGVEVDDIGAGITECNGGAAAGTVITGDVRIGAVPTRALNLPDEYIYDAWGGRLTYAVTMDLASTGQYDASQGAIGIVDSAAVPNSLITPANSAHYAVISHGPDQQGAYPVNGGALRIENCPAAATGGFDAENCDDDAIFLRTILSSNVEGARQFDDQIIYNSYDAEIGLPDGAIIAFEGPCPSGWTDWAAGRGRFILGAGVASAVNYTEGAKNWAAPAETFNAGDLGGHRNYLLSSDQLPGHTHPTTLTVHPVPTPADQDPTTISAGDGTSGASAVATPGNDTLQNLGGGNEFDKMPPYIALNFCQKT